MRAAIGLLTILVFLGAPMFPGDAHRESPYHPPRVISTTEAAYPPNSVQGGTVVLEVTVGPTGAIERVRVVQEAKGFTQQAIEAVRKWKFKPATFQGAPVAASIPVSFSFSQPIVWWTR